MKSITLLELHSQTTRLVKIHFVMKQSKKKLTGFSPSMIGNSCFPLLQFRKPLKCKFKNYNSVDQESLQILRLSFSLFIRHYWENHSYFLFLRLLICLNSAGSLTWFEVVFFEVFLMTFFNFSSSFSLFFNKILIFYKNFKRMIRKSLKTFQ